MPVIDVDSHLHEPLDWLAEVRPDLAAELGPPGRFMEGLRAMNSMIIETLPEADRPEDPLDLMTKEFRAHCEKTDALQPEHLDPGSADPFYTAEGRLALLDEIGVDVAFINPTFSSGHLAAMMGRGSKDLVPRLKAAWNDFAADQLEGHTDRLMPVCQAWVEDVDWTVAEMTRMRERGSRAFNISQHPTKSITHPDFDPMWSAGEDLGMVAYVHVAVGNLPVHPSWANNGRGLAAFQESVVPNDHHTPTRHLLNAMVFDGVFERHPRLVLVLAESFTAWMPPLVHDMDKRLTKVAADGAAQDNFYRLPSKPSEYLARQVKISPLIGVTETGEYFTIPELLERLPGPDMLVYSSDFPHVEGRRDAVTAYDKHLPSDEAIRESFYGGAMADVLAIN
jgi:predicted TIM-barrel fold metal-dependent hydrolase